ncbi:hypothetical protein FIPPAONL_01857 [Lactobacillus gasseri]|uniref:Uncharacterized protein n=1 Tax=Lactobacillus gasseri TaxID=1596 RepID=A0ABY3BBF1_LACGS|nr:hypothetical protein FIPPAONL_01857 [Lactobacillus gasseri]
MHASTNADTIKKVRDYKQIYLFLFQIPYFSMIHSLNPNQL